MLHVGWIAVWFLVVGLIILLLRRFGLPKRRTTGNESKSSGYGSFSGSGASIGGLLQGSPFSRGTAGGSGGGSESVHWINAMLSWIYHAQNRVPDFVESWLTALSTEAEHLGKEIQILFEGIHGSPPEFSNFRTESSSPDKVFTILTTVTLKDVTLQTSVLGKSTAAKASQPVKCDVYIQHLTGQVRCVAQLAQNELSLQLEFVSPPDLKLQIRPTRVDYAIDNAVFEKIVRAVLARAPVRVAWTSHSTSRPAHLRIVEANSGERSLVKRPAAVQLSLQSPMTSVGGYNNDVSPASSSSAMFATPSPPSSTRDSQAPFTQQPETGDFRGHQLPKTPEQQHHRQLQGTQQGQQHGLGSNQGQQYSPPIQEQAYPHLTRGLPFQGTTGEQQRTTGQGQQQHLSTASETLSLGPKLFIKVVKANGLVDNDFGECSAFCDVHIDTPTQDFSTSVIRNTVNPYWDEQFISDFDSRTKQIQFEVLDRDRQQGNNLLGRAVVLVDEIRRMPSSRQIIPLTGKPKSRTSTSGSVTVEFIFNDSIESSPSTSSPSNAGIPFGIGQGQKMSVPSAAQPPPAVKESSFRNGDRARVGSADYSPYGGRANFAAVGPGASQLSAHNLALTSSQPSGVRSLDSPTVVVTGVDSQRSATLRPSRSTRGTMDAGGNIEGKKRDSFANTLRRTLERVKIKPRSQSADRSSTSLRDGNLLRLPDQGGAAAVGQAAAQTNSQQQQQQQQQQQPTNRNAGSASDIGGAVGVENDGTIRKGRSNSFSSSLRRIFRRDKDTKKPNTAATFSSPLHFGRSEGASVGGLTTADQGLDRSRRGNTPVPSGERFSSGGATDFTYSSSVPAPSSPLQSH